VALVTLFDASLLTFEPLFQRLFFCGRQVFVAGRFFVPGRRPAPPQPEGYRTRSSGMTVTDCER